MSDESQEVHQSGLFYFMPHWIFESTELSNTEKLVYSLLSGLAFGNEEKTCFPSDAYIGKRLGIGRQAANDCVASLERIGAITKIVVKHENNPFRNKRIITVLLAPKIILTKSQKDDSRDSQKDDSAVSQKDDSSNKEYSNKEKPPIIPKGDEREACGAVVRLSKEEYQKAEEMCGKEVLKEIIDEMNDYCSAHGKKYKDYLAAIRTWHRKRLKNPQQNKLSLAKQNEEWARKIVKRENYGRMEIYDDCLVFKGVGPAPNIMIKFSEMGFKDQVTNRLYKMGLNDLIE